MPLLTAVQAKRAISARHSRSCTQPFLVMIRPAKELLDNDDKETGRNTRLNDMLLQFSNVFEAPLEGAPVPNLPECIPIESGHKASDRPAFRLSLKERHEDEKQVADLLVKGWIEPSSSNYGAPVLFVPKPDGSMRMCIDCRALNRITTRNKYPLPRIDDLMDNLGAAKYFSSLDLTAGYHQLVLPPSDRPKTAFNTHIGKYEWRVLPMGLTNAPAVFQNTMHRIFRPYLNQFVCVYLDDVLIFSRTEEEHFAHLEIVLKLLQQYHLKAKQVKCAFFKPEDKCLGHIVVRDKSLRTQEERPKLIK
jgi:hypothetical protein